MCRRHNSQPFNFFCMTENNAGIDPNIRIINLPQIPVQGWWFKLFAFNRDLNLKGTVMFLDLDLIIHNNMDKLWDYNQGSFIIIRDFTRHMNPNWKKFNSSVFRFNPSMHYNIWQDFNINYKNIISKNFGDQDHLYTLLSGVAHYWPDNWIKSYKWEMRNKSDLAIVNGRRNFTSVQQPFIYPESCIAVFHGDPNPHTVRDPWVIENWK